MNKSGDLWLLGDTLKNLHDPAIETGCNPKKVPLPENLLCKRAWAMAHTSDYDDVAIYALLQHKETGEKGIYVFGKGTLGLGDKSEAKKFEKVSFGDAHPDIVEIETYGRKLVAVDSEGQLWGWGRSEHKEFGVDVSSDGYKTPALLNAINSLGKVLRYKVSDSHLVVEVQDKSGEKKLYSVGEKCEDSFHHLGL